MFLKCSSSPLQWIRTQNELKLEGKFQFAPRGIIIQHVMKKLDKNAQKLYEFFSMDFIKKKGLFDTKSKVQGVFSHISKFMGVLYILAKRLKSGKFKSWLIPFV